MSVSTKIVVIALLSGGVLTQEGGAADVVQRVTDTVRTMATVHELSILKRAYLLDVIGGVSTDEYDGASYASRRLLTNGRPASVDFWGNPYQLDVGARQVRFWSNGPDGARNTVDDIEVILPTS
jgi:hypothetical protein